MKRSLLNASLTCSIWECDAITSLAFAMKRSL
jgi:hypothetical protein